MARGAIVSGLLLFIILAGPLGCDRGRESALRTDSSESNRYRVEVVATGIDPTTIPDPLAIDFDGDGSLDQVAWSSDSLAVKLSTGGGLTYRVGMLPEVSATRLDDLLVFSLNRDGSYPSILMAVERKTSDGWRPVLQPVVYNDSGQLVLKHLADFPVVGQSLDCAWLDEREVPACFYPSYAGAGGMGLSRLLEIHPEGIWQLAHDREYLRFRNRVGRYDGWFTEDHLAAKDQVLSMRSTSPSILDSLLELGWAEAAINFRDSVRTLSLALSNQERVYVRDITRESGLPWPVQPSYAYDRNDSAAGRWMDGFLMLGAAFTDFTGDGRPDLVAVGQHSAVFSAIQSSAGLFTDPRYHGLPDEYARVSGPPVSLPGEPRPPPCVYHGMELRRPFREEYVECYDSLDSTWYEVSLPGGPYGMGVDRVIFWDAGDDGTMDFAARRKDGSWNLLTFARG